MKRTRSIILVLAVLLSASTAFAMENGAAPEPNIIPPVLAPALILAIENGATAEPVIIPTDLAPAAVSSLANLDLIPQPVSTDSHYVNLNLNPQLASASMQYGQRYLIRDIRAAATGDVMFNVNLAAMVALNAADYFSTRACLGHSGLQEGNPLMKPFVKSPVTFAAVKIGMTAVSYFALKSLYKKSKPLAWIVSFASNLALSYVVSNNFRLHSLAK